MFGWLAGRPALAAAAGPDSCYIYIYIYIHTRIHTHIHALCCYIMNVCYVSL